MARRLGALVLILAGVGCSKAEPPAAADAWEVTIQGYGPIKTGMTLLQAESASGRQLTAVNPEFIECDYVRFEGDTTHGVGFMVILDTIVRVDINDSTISTNHGIRIGDSEARVQERYPDRVTVTPHKYVDGHYLTVAPERPDDSGLELVFETDGSRVTTYRSGRQPEVEYVEGCS
jgi:hypothetical protein